ncbi:MAG: T9SS C-terminal target domain-containing protein, partial [Bacteroidaceae bacterium]|nr:T9SS C-terminal target domain-containing protein [Bacteroidaceae bacterium]
MNNKLLHTLSMLLLAMVAFTFTSCSLFDLDEMDGHEYVDLGLSVKWATCNVGADSPEDYGDYFAWGETSPKSTYDWSTYKWCKGAYDNLTKYNTNSGFGTVDNKNQLDLSDDAARANWGGSWRMPTDEEFIELGEKCSWKRTTQNGVKGYKVT